MSPQWVPGEKTSPPSGRRAGSATLVHTKGGAGTLIEYGTCGPWSHIAIADGEGNFWEAWPGGFRKVPESRYDGKLTADLDVGLSDVQRAAAVAWCVAHDGTPYSWAAIAVFAWRTIGGRVWGGPLYRKFAAWAQNRKAMICSEAWVEMLRAVGADTWPGEMSSEISPNEIGLTGQVRALFYRR